MKKFLDEFKAFVNRGNVMDMAVGVIIGGAFTAIVTALTGNIIEPLIKFVSGGQAGEISGLVIPGTEIDFGKFVSAIINFLIVAFVVFLLVKAVNNLENMGTKVLRKHGEEVVMAPPACPFCLEEVKPGATRCPHCAAALPEPAKPRAAEA